jgi:hypothetical protein
MRLALTAALFVANTWAIIAVLGSRARFGVRMGWTLGITLLPVLGLLLWLGRRRQRT